MSKNKESQLVVVNNEDVADSSLLYLHGGNIEYYERQYIVLNIEFESIVSSIKNDFFRQCMVDFVNKIELSDTNIILMVM